MLILLVVLVAGACVTAVTWIVCVPGRRHLAPAATAGPEVVLLPADDQPPAAAVGWPPRGRRHYATYVDRGFRAIDAYLSEGFANDEGTTGLT